jgi:heme/copper-type cytochrome/quinol oxidase subunit 2
MWPFRRNNDEYQARFSNSTMVAIVVAAISLAVSIGVARWSWLLLDEQILLRNDFEELRARQEQVGIQYEFWLERLQEERADSTEE